MNQSSFLSWEKFHTVTMKGLKVYVFYLAVLSLFRLVFILWLSAYWGADTGMADVLAALWRGFRLSMQTAGALTLVSFLPGLLLHYLPGEYFFRSWEKAERTCWLALNGLLLGGLSILFVASFPFYRQFRMNFNQMLFNGANDDLMALFWTLMEQYALPLRLAGALLLAYILWHLLGRWLYGTGEKIFRPALWPPAARYGLRLCYLGLLYLVCTLGVFGGSLGWQTAVDWENAGVTRDDFLNEAILDSPQAIYRAYELNRRMLACNGLDFTVEDIRLLAASLSGRPADSDNLDDYLLRETHGSPLYREGERPRHVFVVLSESLANWPLLPEYADLPIAPELRELLAEPETDYCPAFLPNGASTVSAVTGVVTGFADANLYLTTMPEAFAEAYPTASAPQLKRLGYETEFYYAGPATWERIGAFTQAQGFERFFSRGDFGDVPGSVWGCEDKYFYQAVLERLTDRPGFHVLLNASNHSPYDVDVEAEGYDKEKMRAALPEDLRGDEELLRELGHYYYAQRELVRFVEAVQQRYPDSLFVLVGDHGDRYNLEKQPPLYVRYGIPFILTGRGVHKGLLPAEAAGSQIDIVPTLIELIAPAGFNYMALGRSLTENRRGVNYGFWITGQAIGKADTVPLKAEALQPGAEAPAIDDQAMQDYINAIRSISWWRPKYGPLLDGEKLKER